jgi:hypothetical protein
LISRDNDGDDDHDELHDVPCMVASEPHVGDPLQMFLDTGKVMRTSTVKRVARRGSELLVETANSRYRLVLSPAA